jgi:hypothetical protein
MRWCLSAVITLALASSAARGADTAEEVDRLIALGKAAMNNSAVSKYEAMSTALDHFLRTMGRRFRRLRARCRPDQKAGVLPCCL